MEPWRTAWRVVAPRLETRGLEALLAALERDDPALRQGVVTLNHPGCDWDARCVGGCPLGYALAHGGEGHRTTGAVRQMYTGLFWHQPLPGPNLNHFTRWVDDSPRELVLRLLREEVALELERRAA